jgi:hypothetical protein
MRKVAYVPLSGTADDQRREKMRQTDWSLEKLIKAFKEGNGRKCFLINKIGTIFWSGGKDGQEAEAFLLKALEMDINPSEKAYAICYLSTAKDTSPGTKEVLEKFRADSANKEVLEHVDIALQRAGMMS